MNSTGHHNSHGVDQGIHQYELSANPGSMTALLNKRRQIEEELAINRSKREQQLLPAQDALLDSSSATDNYHARVRLGAVETEITESFHRVRGLLNELKHIPNQTDTRVKAQIEFIGGKVQREIQDYYKSQREFDQRLRTQVRRRYEIAHPDARPEQIDSCVQGVILGQDQVFQVTGARSRLAREAQAAVTERSVAIRKIEQDLIALSALSQEVAALIEGQEYTVEETQKRAQTAVENYKRGNTHLSGAIISVRNARRYKWYILLVCFLIIGLVVAGCMIWCKLSNHC